MDKRTWKNNKAVIMSLWHKNGDEKWTQGELLKRREYVESISNKNSRAAKARWLKRNEKDDASALPNSYKGDAFKPKLKNKPPISPKGDGVSLDSNEVRNYSIERRLTDAAIMHAQRNATRWAMQELYNVYNQNIRTGRMEPPNTPCQAFPAWCARYTKGNPP